MRYQPVLQLGNLLGAVLTVVVNILATTLPLNNITTAEISDSLPNLFTPAGITFSIWGVIYVLIFVFAFYQLKGLRSGEEQPYLKQISGYFMLSCAANIAWIFLWHYQYIPWTILAMLVLLLSLIACYVRLGIGARFTHDACCQRDASRSERLGVHLLFSVYLGWITVATVANVTAVLVYLGWDGFGLGEATWFIVVLLVGALIGLLMVWRRGDIAYTLVLGWAFLGITLKRLQPGGPYDADPTLAAIPAVLVAVLLVALALRWIRKTPRSSA